MERKDSILQLIKENTYIAAPVTETSHLYTDLCFDSLSFAALLAQIEDIYSITFDIAEMEMCLQVEILIETVENKLKELENL